MRNDEKLLNRTEPALEKRHWVRLTRTCNNHCQFCLDSDCHDGSIIEKEEILSELKKGIENGATRAILSGGEPTIHPSFFEIVNKSKQIGYRWIQVISNGRLFSYKNFTRKAINSGINEVTISMHGHNASMHDALTMVPGSFIQSITGIKNLLATGKCHVSVDIVINSINVDYLPEIIEFFFKLGIKEFDLLFVQPFGRAWKNHHLLLDRKHADKIKQALITAEKLKCWVWTNRVPPEFLEGMEEYIQDPIKLLDDINGRRELLSSCIRHMIVPPCYGKRCSYCVLNSFCKKLFILLKNLQNFESKTENRKKLIIKTIPLYIHPPFDEKKMQKLKDASSKYSKVKSPSFIQLFIEKNSQLDNKFLKDVIKIFPDIPLQLVIRNDPGKKSFTGKKQIIKVFLEPNFIYLMNSFPPDCQKYIIGRNYINFNNLPEKDNINIVYFPEISIKDEIHSGPYLKNLLSTYNINQTINIPKCISNARKPLWFPYPFLNVDWFDENLNLNPLKFAIDFIKYEMMTKSFRCDSCVEKLSCKGIHLSYIRRFGYKELSPVK